MVELYTSRAFVKQLYELKLNEASRGASLLGPMVLQHNHCMADFESASHRVQPFGVGLWNDSNAMVREVNDTMR